MKTQKNGLQCKCTLSNVRVSSAIAPFVAACVVWDESNNKANDNIIVHVNSAILIDKKIFSQQVSILVCERLA